MLASLRLLVPEAGSGFLGGPGQEGFNQSLPLVFERCAAEAVAAAPVPVFSIRGRAFFAMEVGVNGHAVVCLQFVDQGVGLRPVSLGVPPQRFERNGESALWGVVRERVGEVDGVHGGE